MSAASSHMMSSEQLDAASPSHGLAAEVSSPPDGWAVEVLSNVREAICSSTETTDPPSDESTEGSCMKSSEPADDMAVPGGLAAGISSGQLEGSANAWSAVSRSRQAGSAQPQRGGGANRGGALRRGRASSGVETAAAHMGLAAEKEGGEDKHELSAARA